ncbi:MAG TPA: hypothetical protein VFU43_22960 [Streptosporangiaceae bacterium]|nr:hypothetical protein [Streptosporangiaceae bacterium]
MTDQPGYAFEEAARLFETLRRRMRTNGRPAPGDVWAQATREHTPGFATGAPECRYCPICRTIAAARSSGPDIAEHMAHAGLALIAAVRETVAGYQRTRPPRRAADGDTTDVG